MQYTVFDQLKLRVLKGQQRNNKGAESSLQALSAFSAFMLGAVSKCVATCLTYPAIRSIFLPFPFLSLIKLPVVPRVSWCFMTRKWFREHNKKGVSTFYFHMLRMYLYILAYEYRTCLRKLTCLFF